MFRCCVDVCRMELGGVSVGWAFCVCVHEERYEHSHL